MSYREVTVRIDWDTRNPNDPAPPENKHIRVLQQKDYVEIINGDTRIASGNLNIPEVKIYLRSILSYLLGNSKLTDEIIDFIGAGVKDEPIP